MTGPRLSIKENYPLRELTTFKIGGPARYFTEVANENEILEALAFAKGRNLELFVLGSGSNLLISDAGFPGLVIHNKITGLESRVEAGSAIVVANAGHDWDDFTKFCAERDWQGVECLSGIPGTVGAAPVQNIGAYGQSAESVITEVRVIDINTGISAIFDNPKCAFGYRKSLFNTDALGRYIITSVAFRLAVSGHPLISYRDLKQQFPAATNITPAHVRAAVLSLRNEKGLLVIEGYQHLNSAGSFFKNPVVSHLQFESTEKAVREMGGCTNWYWPQASGEVKVSAACMIQTAGFVRGHRQGNVGISPRHALALVNYGNATACEIIAFAKQVQEKVKEKFGVTLKPEVQRVGVLPPLLEED